MLKGRPERIENHLKRTPRRCQKPVAAARSSSFVGRWIDGKRVNIGLEDDADFVSFGVRSESGGLASEKWGIELDRELFGLDE